jgi:hypothetical protein
MILFLWQILKTRESYACGFYFYIYRSKKLWQIMRVSIAYTQILDYIILYTVRAKKLDDMSHREHKFLYNVA